MSVPWFAPFGWRMDGDLGSPWRPGISPKMPQPVRMIFGSADPTGTPDSGGGSCAQLPNGELVLVPGAGHQPWWDEPAEVGAQVGSFLIR